MYTGEFTSYRKVARLTKGLIEFLVASIGSSSVVDHWSNNKENSYPITEYIQQLDNNKDKLLTLKIARALGYNVYMRLGKWYENGAEIMKYYDV